MNNPTERKNFDMNGCIFFMINCILVIADH